MNRKYIFPIFGVLTIATLGWIVLSGTESTIEPDEVARVEPQIELAVPADTAAQANLQEAEEVPPFVQEYNAVFRSFVQAVPVVQEIVAQAQCVEGPLNNQFNDDLVCRKSAQAFADVAVVIGLCVDRSYRYAPERASQRRAAVERLSDKLTQEAYYETLAQIDEIEARQAHLSEACQTYEMSVLPPLSERLAGGNLLRLSYVNHAVLSGAHTLGMEYVDASSAVNTFSNYGDDAAIAKGFAAIAQNVDRLVNVAPSVGYAQRALLAVHDLHLPSVTYDQPGIAPKLDKAVASLMLSFANDRDTRLTATYSPLAHLIASVGSQGLLDNALYLAEGELGSRLDLSGFDEYLNEAHKLKVTRNYRDK